MRQAARNRCVFVLTVGFGSLCIFWIFTNWIKKQVPRGTLPNQETSDEVLGRPLEAEMRWSPGPELAVPWLHFPNFFDFRPAASVYAAGGVIY